MWSKLTSAIKPRESSEASGSALSQGDVMNRVREQHPNLSVFHSEEQRPPSPPASPSKKKSLLKRLSRVPGKEEIPVRSSSPFRIGNPRKVKSSLNLLADNGSQLSLGPLPSNASTLSPSMGRRASQDLLRGEMSYGSTRSSSDALRRPSLDMLRTMDLTSPALGETMSPDDGRFGSVRSILRDPNTPGTGQNVRFFSRDAYKVMSPEQSVDSDGLLQHVNGSTPAPSFLQKLESVAPQSTSTPAGRRVPSHSKSRPSVSDVFSPLNDASLLVPIPSSPTQPTSPSATTSEVLMEINFDVPSFPPGLDFDLNGSLVSNFGHDSSMEPMSSTPAREYKGKGKAVQLEKVAEDPASVDETIFHAQEKAPRLPSVLHERSNSFSFGQTMFFSMENNNNDELISTQDTPDRSSGASSLVHSFSSDTKRSIASSRATSESPASLASLKSRSRALSDTVFHSMLRSRSSTPAPENDINDESSSDLVVYANPSAPEPDPFCANANTYYTPQTMIPVTPPRAPGGTNFSLTHARTTSKEENMIYSLQAQLTLERELVCQYQTDLRARDELCDVLGKKLASIEKEEGKRRSTLRMWKKKVAELERIVRNLEDEVEGSRHESMERSVMDEASDAALRMLHRQIATLEREKGDSVRREDMLRAEVLELESTVKERSNEVAKLQETIWNRDESERELRNGILSAREQMEQMGNVSVATIDEEELKRLVVEREQINEEQKERHQVAEVEWEETKNELMAAVEDAKSQEVHLREEVDMLNSQLQDREEELTQLKAELEAQWSHTEKSTEKIEALEKECRELELERETLKNVVEDLEDRINSMEEEWNDSENRKTELEQELEEVWKRDEVIQKEHNEIEDNLRHVRHQLETTTVRLLERETRIEVLEKEQTYTSEEISRLQDNLRRQDEEAKEYATRILQCETEAERLREQMSNMGRDHQHALEQQARAARDATSHEGQGRVQLQVALREKAEAEVQMSAGKDRIDALKAEVERLRRQVHELQQESADREVKLVQVTKQVNLAQEDNAGLNIALDSKQQELEMIKRKLGVRGTAGSTPAQSSKTAHHRRDSSVFTTPGVSRPSSIISDSGKDELRAKPFETPVNGRISALSRSTRTNAPSTASTIKPRIEGSMGPPPDRPRPSLATPTPAARVSSLSRSVSGKPTMSIAPRRPSNTIDVQTKLKSAKATPAGPVTPRQDKENDQTGTKAKRTSLIPTPA